MSNEQKNEQKQKKTSLFSSRRLRHGGFATLLVVAVIVITILLNIVISTLDNVWGLSYDLSSNRLYTISEQTERVVSAIDEPVHIYALMQTGSESQTVENLLENYRRLAPDYITVTVVDPIQNPTFAQQFTSESLSVNSVIVTNEDGSRYRVIDQYDMYEFGYTSSYQLTPRSFIGEQKLTNAISFVTADEINNAYFLTGHQEASVSDLSYLVDYIEGENLVVDSISLTDMDKLKQGDILIIAAPQTDLSEDERVAIRSFLENGGYMLYLTDATCPELPGFESLLDLYGISVDHTLVIEGNENAYYRSPAYIVPTAEDHAVTAGLTENEQVAVLPYATSLSLPAIEHDDIEAQAILTTSADSYAKVDLNSTVVEQEEGDLSGPLNVGIALREIDMDGNDAGAKIVVFGSAGFVTSSTFYGISGNTDLLLGAIRWMNGETDTVTIIGKNLMTNSLRFTSTAEMYAMAGVGVFLMPVVVLAAGVVVWLKRRHL